MIKQRGNIVDLIQNTIFFGEVIIDKGVVLNIVRLSDEMIGEEYVLPGFVDSHVHIESSMVVPSSFARVAVRSGVVATVSDPHEIANVLGVDGVKYMQKNGSFSAFKFFFGVPSCVPAVGFDRSGFILDSRDVEKMFESGEYYYLAEMMNFPGVIAGDGEVVSKIKSAISRGLKVDGHAPGLSGDVLRAYAAAGISSDHECMSVEEALEKINLGMKVQIREGSAAKNFDSLVDILRLSPENVMLCSDDCHPDDLLDEYFLKQVKRALNKGYDLFDVLRASSYNAVKHYGISVGMLQQNDSADFIVVDNLENFEVRKTVISGNVVYENGEVFMPDVQVKVVNNFYKNYISESDLKILCNTVLSEVKVKVISTIEGELYTKREDYDLSVVAGEVMPSLADDVLKIVVLNRYQKAAPTVGFIKGFGLKRGAICSSVAHDSHNIVAIGVDDASIAKVINSVVDSLGGLAYADDDVLEVLPLPVAGIMSDKPVEDVAEKYRNLLEVAKNSGSIMKAPFMTMAFMSLVVIPELKISDQYLFDVTAFKPTSLFVNE